MNYHTFNVEKETDISLTKGKGLDVTTILPNGSQAETDVDKIVPIIFEF